MYSMLMQGDNETAHTHITMGIIENGVKFFVRKAKFKARKKGGPTKREFACF